MYNELMNFEWDEDKRRENLHKHGVDFADVPSMFDGPMLLRLDTREEYGEDRWIGIGFLGPLVAVVVYVERFENTIRLISVRKANRYERESFEHNL